MKLRELGGAARGSSQKREGGAEHGRANSSESLALRTTAPKNSSSKHSLSERSRKNSLFSDIPFFVDFGALQKQFRFC